MKQLVIFEQDFLLLIRGEAVQLDAETTVCLSTVLSLNHIAALVACELSTMFSRQAIEGAVLPETKRRLALAVDNTPAAGRSNAAAVTPSIDGGAA